MRLEPVATRPHDVYNIPVPATAGRPIERPLGLLLRRTFEKVVAVMTAKLLDSGLPLRKVRAPTAAMWGAVVATPLPLLVVIARCRTTRCGC
jgi:hypothetical protein